MACSERLSEKRVVGTSCPHAIHKLHATYEQRHDLIPAYHLKCRIGVFAQGPIQAAWDDQTSQSDRYAL